jgi:hypothetical protein
MNQTDEASTSAPGWILHDGAKQTVPIPAKKSVDQPRAVTAKTRIVDAAKNSLILHNRGLRFSNAPSLADRVPLSSLQELE